MKGYLIIVCVVLAIHTTYSANILAIFPLCVSSHFTMFEKLLKGLVQKGHEVDVISHFPQKRPIPRYNDMSIAGIVPSPQNNVSADVVVDTNPITIITLTLELEGYETCEILLDTEVMRNLKKTTKQYDVLITEIFFADCSAAFAHHFGVPLISVVSSVALPWVNDRIGNPDNPSYIPSYFLPYTSKMGLIERLINTVFTIGAKLGYGYVTATRYNKVVRKFFGEDFPNLEDIIQNTSLVLVNSHFSLNQARPTVPNFIEVGGLHIGDVKPLPDNIKNILEKDIQNGIIYLSMGSMVLTETFDEDKLQGMFDAFAELPYKVFWKATKEKFPKNIVIPNNIFFETWIPQLDVLCHPNVKLFVTHSGLMGTQEAIYCGKPTLSIPLFADQYLNARWLENRGMGLQVPYHDITKDRILNGLKTVLGQEKYTDEAQKVSKLFKDRPSTPLETAIYWIEYVIRHKGAPQLRSAATDLYWYQYCLLDVFCLFFGTVVLTVYIVYHVTIRLLRKLTCSG